MCIRDSDYEDDEYLQDYRLENENQRRYEEGIRIQEYGNIRQKMRPSQIFILEEARRKARQEEARGELPFSYYLGLRRNKNNSNRAPGPARRGGRRQKRSSIKKSYRNRTNEIQRRSATKRRGSIQNV